MRSSSCAESLLVGLAAGEQLEGQHAQAVDVAARVHRLAERLLGAQIVGRADDVAVAGVRDLHGGLLGHAEVGQGQGAVLAEHQVVGLEVAVHDADVVDGGQAGSVCLMVGFLGRNGPCFMRAQVAPRKYSMAM